MVLDNFNLKIEKGERMCLLGPSGCGKTTALRLIAGLEVPDKGKITINDCLVSSDKNILKETPERGIGIVFQDLSLFPHLNIFENVSYALHEFGNEKMKERSNYLLDCVGMLPFREKYPHMISGGEQQRVAIARALIAKTNLILADEPTGNLDFKTSKEIFSYFLKLKKLKKTIIFATHNRELANRADYKLFISNGDIKRVNAR